MRLAPWICLVVCISAAAGPAESFPRAGEWPAHRRDGSQQARSPALGHVTQPRLVWKQFVGVLESWLVIEPGGRDTALPLPREAVNPSLDPLAAPEWGMASSTAGSLNAVISDVLPEFHGAETFEFESGFNKPTVNGQWQDCVGRCFVSLDGRRAQLWETAPIHLLFQALPLAGDFDDDGQPDLALLPWHELLLLDARTGRVKDRCRFTEGRSYGYFGACDLDGDGRAEFVVQSDFAKHVDILGFREGKLTLLWQRTIELDISNPQKILRAGPHPVADVDGDGRKEVIVNCFNDAGDQRWHLTLHDGLTGVVKADLPDEFCDAALDLDGDGTDELLTTTTKGAGVPEFGTIRVRSLTSGSPTTRWEQRDAGWQHWEPPLPTNAQSGATFGRRTVLGRRMGKTTLAVIRSRGRGAGARIQIQLVRWGKDGFKVESRVAGPGVEGSALDAEGRILLRAHHAPEETVRLKLDHGRASLLCTKPLGGAPGPAIAVRPEGAKRPTIAVQGHGEELVLFEPPADDRGADFRPHHLTNAEQVSDHSDRAAREPESSRAEARAPVKTRRRPGRGQSTQWPQTLGPVAVDLRGDGQRQLLLATAAPDGSARLRAVDLRGRELWHRDFPGIPGTPPVWNTGGLILWQGGHFTDSRRQDVLVTVRRSMMHSDETYLLDGRDGRELWHRDRQISQRSVGGAPFAIADFDGDGLDDLCQLYPSLYCLMRGQTGRDLLAMDATWNDVPAKPVYWGVPFAVRRPGEAKASVLFGGRSMTGLVKANGKLAWWDALDKAAQGDHAFGDFDGDGHLEAIGVGYDAEFRCYDLANGTIRWRLSAPANEASVGCASADLDGDGRDEAVFVIGRKLLCVGSEPGHKRGALEWELPLPTQCGPPTLATLETEGGLSILLTGADGYVYCFR